MLNPLNADAYYNRGHTWQKKREYDKAIADFNQALRIDPTDAAAYNELAWLYATCPDEKCRDGKKAVENAEKAYQLTEGKNLGYIDTLAAAHAENGDFEKAKEWAAKAVEMASTDKTAKEQDKQEMRDRLKLYDEGKPYREEPKQKWQREGRVQH